METKVETNPYITPALFDFFRELKTNNDRDWFEANKPRYERDVREPLLQFITDFGLRLAEISPHYLADARKSGGSLFRIYRDVRFSKDKTPYKTQAGVHFRHESAKDAHAPGFYLHLEPGEVFIGVGIWRPDSKTVRKIRDYMVEHPEEWTAITRDAAFTEIYELRGESLKRGPKGYDLDHPLIEDLKRKDFIAVRETDEATACTPDFMDRFAMMCHRGSPFNRFLTEALGLPY